MLARRAIEVRLNAGRPISVDARAVLEVAGPWRADEAWWTTALETGGHPIQNDAYDVLLDDGALIRIINDHATWYLCGSYD